MPGFNGMGPGGSGPMTGRGRGFCIGYVDQAAYQGPYMGRGVGRGRRRRYRVNGLPADSGQELNFLRERVNSLENAVEQARQRISRLEGQKEG